MTIFTHTDFVEQHTNVGTAISLLDKWTAKRVHDRQQPGLSMGILYDGALIWSAGYGYADLERTKPATPDTVYRIASISKTFTATAILQLRDAGKLRLDDPLSAHLPWFKLQYVGAPSITIRHALTHTSGLPRDANIPQWTENSFQMWDKVVETTQEREPVMPPVTDFKYSNLAYALLGGVIEAVSGQAYEAYVQQHILDPLAMDQTFVAPTGDEAQLATGYLRTDAEYVRKSASFVDAKGFAAATGLASTVNDLAKYAAFHLSTEANGVLSPHTLRDMHRIHWLDDKWERGQGLGVMVLRVKDWTISGHGGGYKGYLTSFTVCREHKFGVIALTNAIDSDPFAYTDQAYKLVLPPIIEATEEKKADPDPAWAQYVGTYAAEWGESEVIIRDGQLQIVVIDFLEMPPSELLPTDEPHVFKIVSPFEGGETARFELDDEGQITRMWRNNEYSMRKQ